MWSMISGSCGWRSAIGANFGMLPGARNMTGRPAFSAAGQNQSAAPSGARASGAWNVSRTPSMPGCSLHFRQQRRRLRPFSGMRPMTAKRSGYRLRRLKRIIVAIARPRRRHDDDAIDAGLVHHRNDPLDGEGLGQLRLATGHPRPAPAFPPSTDALAHRRSCACARGRAAGACADPGCAFCAASVKPAPTVLLRKLRRDHVRTLP